MKTILTILFVTAVSGFTVRAEGNLNSHPTASATIYLDFDGEQVISPVWNNGVLIDCAAPALSNMQITEIFNRVAEDYRPFNVNITTDLTTYLAAPYANRIRVIVTTTSSWFTGVGGIAFVGSFTWGDDTPCFVFSDRLGLKNPKKIAECCSHESGHALGLSHQSKYDGNCNLTATYNEGSGNGEAAWAPIMGNSYARNMTGWNNGPTPYGCSNQQDNLSIITSANGFNYRMDDYSDEINNNTITLNNNNIDISGIISTNTDKDVFRLSLTYASNFHLEANPFSVSSNNEGANLDVRLSIYDASNNLINTYNPSNTMGVLVDTILSAGIYYIVVDGTGNSNASDYGSLGSYTLKGISGVLPICNVQLTGLVITGSHQLNWNIVCNESLRDIALQSSVDGIYFTEIRRAALNQSGISCRPEQVGNLYYRLQITTATERITYSNTVLLKQAQTVRLPFVVSSIVKEQISIQSAEQFDYHLLDLNGNYLAKGSGSGGFTHLSLLGKPNAVYILRLASRLGQQTFRVVKQ